MFVPTFGNGPSLMYTSLSTHCLLVLYQNNVQIYINKNKIMNILQYNGQKKKNKTINKTLHRKLKIEQHEPH